MKILVVDDEVSKFLQIKPILERIFTDVSLRHVKTQLAAIRQIETYQWDLVILDMAFTVNEAPSEDAGFEGQAGLEVLQHIHRLGYATKVVIFTAQPQFDGSDQLIGNIQSLRAHVSEFFGNFCLGCVFSKQSDEDIFLEVSKLLKTGGF